MTRTRWWPVLMLSTGLSLLGCGDGDDTVDSSTASSSSTTSSTSDPATPVTLSASSGPPPELRAGLVTTSGTSKVKVTFEVPEGWYGAGDDQGFGIGKGLDETIEDFARVGVIVHTTDLSVDEAVQGFRALSDLDVVSTSDASVDGHVGSAVEVTVTSEHVILEPIGIRADIPRGPAVVTFLDVDGQTVVISVQLWKSDADKAEAQAVVDSFDFTPS